MVVFVQRCVEAHERRSVAIRTETARGNTSKGTKAKRGSADGNRVKPTRSKRTLRVLKSSKSQTDDTLTWRARMSVTQNDMEESVVERQRWLPGRENL
jgi:hypothetical protein